MRHPLSIAFIWHMHQPYYRDRLTGECRLPWVRLHGTKDYLDMVQLLEQFPAIHQTFNFAPSLLEQLQDYGPPLNRSDTILDLCRKPMGELSEEEKRLLLEQCFMANVERMIKPYPRYHDLLAKRGPLLNEQTWPAILKRFKPQDYLDLQAWFHLAWIDPWLRRNDPDLTRLETKGGQFTDAEKQLVLEKHLALLQRILPMYRAAQERGQIELTCSPYYHPIMPLLCDLRSAQPGLPQAPLPHETFRHPEDAAWHLREALAAHERLFGRKPSGLWPSEGGVSEEVIRLVAEAGIRWIATDEEILWRTLKTAPSPALRYQPHLARREGKDVAIVFRDRELSDLLGFVYSQWHPQLAIHDFLRRLEHISEAMAARPAPALVSIILDGENAWEHYPHDGYDFLHGLYEALAQDARFKVVTVSEFLAQHSFAQAESLPPIFPGSWIDGNFGTWIGQPEKNMAWTLIAHTRADLTALEERGHFSAEILAEAWRNLYIAEGSDWMWWFGETHSSSNDEEFDRLFRTHLSNVYRSLNQSPPERLQTPIKRKRAFVAGTPPTAAISPRIDGMETTYYEWLYAGSIDLRKDYAAMHRGRQQLQWLWYGADSASVYLRADLHPLTDAKDGEWTFHVEFPEQPLAVTIQHSSAGALQTLLNHESTQEIACAYAQILELSIPRTLLNLPTRIPAFSVAVSLSREGSMVERYPAQGAFHLSLPSDDDHARMWSV